MAITSTRIGNIRVSSNLARKGTVEFEILHRDLAKVSVLTKAEALALAEALLNMVEATE